MTQAQKNRQFAAGATRSQLRKSGFDPKSVSGLDALLTLDDICRDRTLKVSEWYHNTSDRQIDLFIKEW